MFEMINKSIHERLAYDVVRMCMNSQFEISVLVRLHKEPARASFENAEVAFVKFQRLDGKQAEVHPTVFRIDCDDRFDAVVAESIDTDHIGFR